MTVGSHVFGSVYEPYFYSKTWNGVDGKYDTSGRLKRNNYSCDVVVIKQTTDSGYYSDFRPGFLALSNNAQLKLLSKVADMARGHSFNLGVFLGTGHETLSLAATTANRLSRAVRAVKRGDIANALRTLGAPSKKNTGLNMQYRKLHHSDPASLWLEIQYGWRPLIQDVYESMHAYHTLAQSPRVSRFTASVKEFDSIDIPYVNPLSSCFDDSAKRSVSRTLHVELLEDLSVARSLGLSDPRPILWELLPFSFVADWFIPIGSYFDNLAVIPHLNANFYQTDIKNVRSVRSARYRNALCTATVSIDSSRFQLVRSQPSSLTIPSPSFKPLGKALSTGHLKNAVALLSATVGGR